MNTTDWTTVMDSLRILSPVLGTWAIILLRQMLKELREMNLRLVRVEDWQANHDLVDNMRFTTLQEQVNNQRDRIESLRATHN